MKNIVVFVGILFVLAFISTGVYFVAFNNNHQQNAFELESETSTNKQKSKTNKTLTTKELSEQSDTTETTSNNVTKSNPESKETPAGQTNTSSDKNKTTHKKDTLGSLLNTSNQVNPDDPTGKKIKQKKYFSLLEIELIDDNSNQKILNTEGIISLYQKNILIATKKFKTDANGKFEYEFTEKGTYQLSINLKEYAIALKYKSIKNSKEFQSIRIIKGGKLFIRVVDQGGVKIEDIHAKIATRVWGMHPVIPQYVYNYNKDTGIHEFNKIPIGLKEVMIESDGFQNSAKQKSMIKVSEVSELKIQLNKSLVLNFNLMGISKMPNSFLIQPYKKTYKFRPQRLTSTPEEIFLNDKNQYEFENKHPDLDNVKIFVNGYIPVTISIKKDTLSYDVHLEKGIEYKVIIYNEEKKVLPGIEITYYTESISFKATSNDKGVAFLNGLLPKKSLTIYIKKKGYLQFRFNTRSLDKNKNVFLKEIILKKSISLEGTVKFGKQLIQGVKISFKQNKTSSATKGRSKFGGNSAIFTDENGKFIIEGLKEGRYTISATHQDYGLLKISDFELKKINEKLELELKAGDTYIIRLSFEDNTPFSSKKIMISGNSLSRNLTTDETGSLFLKNLVKGKYYIFPADKSYKLDKRTLIIPDDNNVTFTIQKKSSIKLIISNENGQAITKGIRIKRSSLNSVGWASPVLTKIIDNNFLEFSPNLTKWSLKNIYYTIEAEGYLNQKIGPFTEAWEGEKEISISLVTSDKFSISLTDKSNGEILAYVTVELWAMGRKILSVPTNENGEFSANKPDVEFIIKVNHKDFAPLEVQYNESSPKNIKLELTQGGILEGKIKIPEGVANTMAYLHKNSQSYHQGKRAAISPEGTFRIKNIAPGEYRLLIYYRMEKGKSKQDKIQTPIFIEENKVTEFNLVDEGDTTLDIKILENGALTNTKIYAQLTNRAGKTIYTFNILKGAHHFNNILAGEYFLNFSHNKRKITKKIIIINLTHNQVDIPLSTSLITLTVKNEKNEIIPKALVNLYIGKKFNSLDSYIGQQSITQNGIQKLYLSPNESHYIVIEEELKFNYQAVVIGPISLNLNQSKNIEVILPNARHLPNLVITDENNNPLKDVAFITSSKTNPFMQRASWKAAGLYPYSNIDGYLPENGWPLSDFHLSVTKKGFETLKVFISKDLDPKKILQIKLRPEAIITCSINPSISTPISIGIIDNAGKLVSQPIPLSERNKKNLNHYKLSITNGKLMFRNLSAGTYYLGYFWNGTTQVIQRQGPINLAAGENLLINANVVIPD
ncbi:MAG: hypothetical protein COA79_18555 [Planctomycetota bacterium]|nr:MAG: hypothetical protein COA79_18555 [Planctomycetota bacterium]